MTPPDAERWARVDELFAEALELPPGERTAFLDRACAGDDELRRAVESLLSHDRDDDFLATPVSDEIVGQVLAAGRESLVGERIGRFEVLARLGEGGMGDVYLARDPKLDRKVALKLLPAHLADDPERVRRFRREALAVSALNHPNILTVYEVLESDGRELLISEHVDGVTLRERLGEGPLPVAAALDLATQTARALAAAHGVGIVHRDVKPENVMLRRDGLVKLLDFGIAKNVERRGESSRPRDAQPQTLTAAGMVLGTACYMSPEQARGEAAGKQSDVWALGCLLYEALTGKRAFPGSDPADILVAILSREPDWDALPAATPPLARSSIVRCLRKEPRRRFQDIGDVALELEEAAAAHPSSAARPVVPRVGALRGRRAWITVLLTSLVAVALGVAVMTWRRPAPKPELAIRFELAPPPGQRFSHWVEAATLALSPDGSLLGFVALDAAGPSTAIWVRPLSEVAARRIPGTEGASSLFWSPDGRHLGFVAAGKLKRVPVAGGTPIPVCEVEGSAGVSGSWSSLGWILFASIQGEAIYRVAADGGTPTVALRPDAARGESRVAWPWWLPDGRRFLYLGSFDDGSTRLGLADPPGVSRSVAPLTSRMEFVDPDLLVYASEGALLAQRIDLAAGALVGAPRPLASPVRAFSSTGWAAFASSRRGPVVVATKDDLFRHVLVDAQGRELSTIGSSSSAASLAVSPDGRRAVTDRKRPGLETYDLWMLDLERGVESRLTDDPATEVFARWLPDGGSVVLSTMATTRGGPPNLVRLDLASGREEPLVPPGPFQIAAAVTPDGARLLYRQRTEGGFELLAAPLDGTGPPASVLRPGVLVRDAALSPDGRVLAHVSPENGRSELFVRPFDGGESVRVSEGGAGTARFSADGKTLFFTTADRKLAAVSIAGAPELSVGKSEIRFAVADLGWLDFDVLPDGRFLALVRESDGTVAPLTVLSGWNGAGGGLSPASAR